MTSDSTLDPTDPFATPFMLKNDGYETLKDIGFSCAPRNIAKATGGSINTERFGVIQLDLFAKSLLPDETNEIFCQNIFKSKSPIVHIDLNIFVSFKIKEWPREFFTCFRFATSQDSQGNLRWLSKSFEGECEFPQSGIMPFWPPKYSN